MSIQSIVGKISRHQNLQDVSNCHRTGVLQKSSLTTEWQSSVIHPLSVTSTRLIPWCIQPCQIVAHSTSLVMSSLDTQPTTSWMTINSNTIHCSVHQALPPHGSSQHYPQLDHWCDIDSISLWFNHSWRPLIQWAITVTSIDHWSVMAWRIYITHTVSASPICPRWSIPFPGIQMGRFP